MARTSPAAARRRPRPALEDRPLLTPVEAVEVAALFKMLGNDTRIRLLHHLIRTGEATVTALGRALGMKPQAVSNQLLRLSDTGALKSRRDGNNVYYRVVDGCVSPLIDLALCLTAGGGKNGCGAGGRGARSRGEERPSRADRRRAGAADAGAREPEPECAS